MTPRLGATYRLQLGPALGFDEAAAHVDYLASLGIQCLYCSPIAEAVPGSAHGYDGTDPTQVRAELGGADAFRRLASALADAHMGCLLDIVPNHLSTWPGGPWWRDVLRSGPDSSYAEVFDIGWDAGGGKVTLPLLDRPLAEVLAEGGITVEIDAGEADGDSGGETVVRLGDVSLPVRGGRVRPDEDLAEVLAAQHYRLVDWHDRRDRNYRRFFDVDGLVGVRVERPAVFDRTHALVGELVGEGLVTALRVDHVDGLAYPGRYLRRLERLTGGVPVIVEKILTGDERLRGSWTVAGTTGYEVLDDIGGALVEPGGLEQLAAAAEEEGERCVEACTATTRRLVATESFGAELERVAGTLGVDAQELADTTARLPVYRTYLDGGPIHPDDAVSIAIATVGQDEVREALADPGRIAALTAWQQLTGAVMAKGVEDTAWYRLPGRLAFCEIGGAPGRPRVGGVERLHARAAARAASGRAGLVPSSTHDTKRSGDARSRLYALSELARPFEEGLRRFRERLPAATGLPGAEEDPGGVVATQSRLLAQTLLSVLPADAGPADHDELALRVQAAVVKGAREAKLETSWDRPDLEHERRLGTLVAASLACEAQVLRESFGGLVGDVARLGATLSLAAVLLRSALPGTPDCYQGDEVWNLALVDPDNRRPVDLGALASRLAAIGISAGAWSLPPGLAERCRSSWRNGDVKLLVTAAALHARRVVPEALEPSALHLPLEATGAAASSLIAFARRSPTGGPHVVAVATRLAGQLAAAEDDLPAGSRSYSTTELLLPEGARGPLVDACTGRVVEVRSGRIAVAEALAELPVALLTRA